MSPAISLQEAVLKELRFDPRVDASRIGVTATPNGVVTLTGTVQVFIPGGDRRSDTDIAEFALIALKARATPLDQIKVSVKDGWVTLEGEFEYYFQRQEAEQAVAPLAGVKGVTNNIRVRPRPVVNEQDIKKQIEEALVRSAQLDAHNISVRVEGTKVIPRRLCALVGRKGGSRKRRMGYSRSSRSRE